MTNGAAKANDQPIDRKSAYLAMCAFLESYWERGNRSDEGLAALLGGMSACEDQTDPGKLLTNDPAYWSDWEKAIERARRSDQTFGMPIWGSDSKRHND